MWARETSIDYGNRLDLTSVARAKSMKIRREVWEYPRNVGWRV